MNYRERGSHAQGVSNTGYLVHGNSKGEADTRITANEKYKIWLKEMEVRTGKSPKQGLTSAKILPMKLERNSLSYI